MAQDQSATMAAAAAREIAASSKVDDPAQLEAVLNHVQQFHSVDMVGLYRDGALVKVVANPRAPIQEVSEPPRKFFDDVLAGGRATKIDVGANGKWIRVATRIGTTPYVAIAGVFIPATMSRLIDESIIATQEFRAAQRRSARR